MKLGYDAKYLWEGKEHSAKSGHGVHALEMLRSLMKVDLENEYRVYLIDETKDVQETERFKFVRLPSIAQSSYWRNLIAYPMELRRNPIDLLMTYTAIPSFIQCKTILFLADIFWIAHPEWIPKKYSIPLGISTRMSVKKADKIATTTEFSKREIMKYLKVPAEKIEVVPHGIRARFLEKPDPEQIERVKKKYGIEGDYLLSINDIHPRKNLDGLLDAFTRLKETRDIPHQMVFVGRTLWPYPEFFGKIENSKYKNDIILPGYVDTEDLRPLYQGATVFVYPSFYEGWGLQAHEAMSCGTPLAVSNSSTLTEISGDAAVSFDPYSTESMSDALFKVLDDPQLRKDLVEKGFEQIKKYSWDDAARLVVDIARKLV